MMTKTMRAQFLILILFTFCVKANAQQFGRVSSAPCPYGCQTLGLDNTKCREWKKAGRCYVHDFTKGRQPTPISKTNETKNGARVIDRKMIESCKFIDPYYITTPRVNITSVAQPGPYFRGTYQVKGSVDGTCIVDASYFEDGELIKSLPVITSRSFHRFTFELSVPPDKIAEIRSYNVYNQRASKRIDTTNATNPINIATPVAKKRKKTK